MLLVILAAAMGVVAHADGTGLAGGTIPILCHQQWEGNMCP